MRRAPTNYYNWTVHVWRCHTNSSRTINGKLIWLYANAFPFSRNIQSIWVNMFLFVASLSPYANKQKKLGQLDTFIVRYESHKSSFATPLLRPHAGSVVANTHESNTIRRVLGHTLPHSHTDAVPAQSSNKAKFHKIIINSKLNSGHCLRKRIHPPAATATRERCYFCCNFLPRKTLTRPLWAYYLWKLFVERVFVALCVFA